MPRRYLAQIEILFHCLKSFAKDKIIYISSGVPGVGSVLIQLAKAKGLDMKEHDPLDIFWYNVGVETVKAALGYLGLQACFTAPQMQLNHQVQCGSRGPLQHQTQILLPVDLD
ncbi:hypothetical protein B0H10DRAFT_1937844 [Mycena sp. CBHHK59/15]|nr:hypothetical protein B0H10DRAFT_1937844 [Mycena sp. CBHHK59/15]